MLNEQGDEPAEQQGVVGGGGGRSPGQGVIHVTQEEKEAIDRVSIPVANHVELCQCSNGHKRSLVKSIYKLFLVQAHREIIENLYC